MTDKKKPSQPKPLDPLRDIPKYIEVFRFYVGRRMYLVFGLSLLAALAEGVGILMLLPLLHALDAGSAESSEGVGKVIIDGLEWIGLGGSIVAVLLLIGIFFLLKGGFTFFAAVYKVRLTSRLTRELRRRLLDDYMHMKYGYYVSRDTGHFTNIITSQIGGFVSAFQGLIQFGSVIVTTLIYFALAFVVAWSFGLMAVVIGGILLMLFRALNHYVRTISRKGAVENGHLMKLLVQSLQAFKYLSATAQGEHLRKGANTSIDRIAGYQLQIGIASSFTAAIREPITVFFIIIILLVQLVWLEQPLAPILVSILLFHRGLGAVLGIQGAWQSFLGQVGAVEIVRDEFAEQKRQREVDGRQVIGPLTKSITLQQVHFRYKPELEKVLDGLSLEIPVRTSVALVGESGAGKSTLVDLLTLMLRPEQGEVFIDGVASGEIRLDSWRCQIGYVSQETVVFDDTIANNICLWEGDIATDPELCKRVEVAAKQAHIAHFIDTLSGGYNTLVGDRGICLSGGQRQRLFIARELFKRPNLLILDEATSALDSESERAIQQSIDALKGDITVVIIAHRLSTIRNVDQIYVIGQGKVIESGAYEELKNRSESRLKYLTELQKL